MVSNITKKPGNLFDECCGEVDLFTIGLYIFNHGGNAVKFIIQEKDLG